MKITAFTSFVVGTMLLSSLPSFSAEKSDVVWARDAESFLLSDKLEIRLRFEMGGKPFVFVGGLANETADRPEPTAFFLVPAEAFDAKIVLPRGKKIDVPISQRIIANIGLLTANGSVDIDVPDARIYRVFRKDGGWSLVAISDPLPKTTDRMAVLHALSLALGQKVQMTSP